MLIKKLIFSALFFFATATVSAAPDLTLQHLDGQTGSLEEHVGQGKWTLVVFWATDCGICKIQQPEYSAFHERHKDIDAQVVGVAIDGTDQLELINDYLEENPMAYPTLVGDKADIREKYKIATEETFRGTPTYWLFSPEGELMANQPGMLRSEMVENYIAKQSK
jgi:peroxiredoxin